MSVSITSAGVITEQIQLAGKMMVGLTEQLKAGESNPDMVASADAIVALLEAISTVLPLSLAEAHVSMENREFRNWSNINTLLNASAAGQPYDISFSAGRSAAGIGEDIAVQSYGSVQLAHDVSIVSEVGYAEVVPTGTPIIVDVLRNGTSIYATLPQIDISTNTMTAGVLTSAPDPISAVAGDRIEFKITQIGSIIAGQKVTFTLKGQAQ